MHSPQKLFIDRNILNIGTPIAEINKDNLCYKKICIANFCYGFGSEVAGVLSHAHLHEGSIVVVQDCVIHWKDARILASFIKDSNVSTLRISKCSTTNNNVVSIIIDAVQQSMLRELNFEYFRMQECDTKAIVNLLKQPLLTELSFFKCNFANFDLVSILSAVETSTLVTLNLRSLSLKNEEIIALASCIANSKLTKLSLNNTSIATIEYLVTEAIKQSSIKILDVRWVQIFMNCDAICDLLLNSCVTKLKFSQARFNNEERVQIINSMRQNNFMKNIYLRGLIYGDDHLLTKVCDLLENSSSDPTHLDIRSYVLPNAKLNKIINSIKRSTITSLYLYGYGLGRPNVQSICDLLESHKIRKLKLNYNDCTNETMNLMLPSIMQSSLIKFDIDKCVLVDESVRCEIKQILHARQQNVLDSYNTKSARSC